MVFTIIPEDFEVAFRYDHYNGIVGTALLREHGIQSKTYIYTICIGDRVYEMCDDLRQLVISYNYGDELALPRTFTLTEVV